MILSFLLFTGVSPKSRAHSRLQLCSRGHLKALIDYNYYTSQPKRVGAYKSEGQKAQALPLWIYLHTCLTFSQNSSLVSCVFVLVLVLCRLLKPHVFISLSYRAYQRTMASNSNRDLFQLMSCSHANRERRT